MSLFSTLQTGASGLGVSGQTLGVIGDNIANLNTVGFKRNRANFADALPQDVSGVGGPSQLGRGATSVAIGGQFTQGALSTSGNALDLALSGAGWFQVNDGNQSFYTRDGSFGLDSEGYVVTQTGYRVQGYNADAGILSPSLNDLQITETPVPPQATSTVTLEMVLNSEDINTIDYSALTLDGTATTLTEASDAADFQTSFTVYDSLGRSHEVVVNFERDAADPNLWSYSAVIDAGETDVAGGVAGSAFEIGAGTLAFDTDGNLTTNTYAATGGWTWPGATAWDPVFEFGLDTAGVATDGSVTNNGSSSTVTALAQDGYAMGDLTSISVDAEGIVRGQYSNGQEQALGQVGVAQFDADGGLDRLGLNLYAATAASGDPAVGVAGTGGRGSMVGFSLERSNVDLENEFVDLIQAQRTYQANAGVIRTADETLQELVNLV
ncbi:MAG: flagellar hook protein FlgE [Myxococcales bacterium]|nr:flagellar hook protein FlgE [Myxococcales bacterium]